MPTSTATDEQKHRLANVLGWLRIAKKNLPAVNDGCVSADRVAALSALVDRIHAVASALEAELASGDGRRAA